MSRPLCVVLGMLILMIDGYDLQSVGFVAADICKAWSIELGAFGPVFAAGLAGTIPGAMLAGSSARAIGRPMSLGFSLLIFGAGSFATAYATDLTQLTAIRFVLGVGLGASVPLVLSLVADNTAPKYRATLATLALCGQPLGAMLGAAICARLVAKWGWPAAFQFGGVLPLLLLPVIGIFRESPAGGSIGQTPLGAPTTVRSESTVGAGNVSGLFCGDLRLTTVLLCASTFLAATLVYVMSNWLPGIARSAGFSLQQSLLAIGLFNFGGIAGALVQGVLIDRFGPKRSVIPAFILAAIAICLLQAGKEWPPLLLFDVLVAGFAGYGATIILGPLALLTYPPALRTTGTGWVLGLGRLGGVLSPLTVGWMLASGVPPSASFYLAAVAAFLAAVLLATLFGLRSSTVAKSRPAANSVSPGGTVWK